MQSGRIASLVARKAQLDTEVRREASSVNPDQTKLLALKRQKLQLKDQLYRLQQSQ